MAGSIQDTNGDVAVHAWETPAPLTNPSKGHLMPLLLAVALSLASVVLLVLAVPMR